MDWKLAATTFGAVFLAELGDKTQLATFALAAGAPRGRLSVFLGSALALVLASALGVAAGALLGRAVPLVWVERAAGVVFLVLGAAVLWRSFQPA